LSEIKALNLDTIAIEENEYYFLTDEQILKQPVNGLQFLIYIRHKYGDEWQKVLRVNDGKEVRDIVLAMAGGDSDSYTTSTEFVNDTLFVEKRTHTETSADEDNLMAYETDSITTTYRYDEKLNLKLLTRDSIRFIDEQRSENNKIKSTTRIMHSKNFVVNGLTCYGNFITTYEYNAGVNGTEKDPLAAITLQFIRIDTGQTILTDSDLQQPGQAFYADVLHDNFKDINFDGYIDFINYNWQSSGSGGAVINAYLFNPEKKIFEASDLSGGELTIDPENKTLSTYWKMGIPWNNQLITHFGEKGRILYRESITREVTRGDTIDKLITTYIKEHNGKVVEKKIDTTTFEGY